ncbi:hypothetical protein PCK1_000723 [Pneumocystis canis]|nr:hypothetical protein PCK1_000723 [Pneumocystis canis]
MRPVWKKISDNLDESSLNINCTFPSQEIKNVETSVLHVRKNKDICEDIDSDFLENLDGEPMENLDGEPMENLDGEPMESINEECFIGNDGNVSGKDITGCDFLPGNLRSQSIRFGFSSGKNQNENLDNSLLYGAKNLEL